MQGELLHMLSLMNDQVLSVILQKGYFLFHYECQLWVESGRLANQLRNLL